MKLDVFEFGAGMAFAGIGLGAFILLISISIDMWRRTTDELKHKPDDDETI